MANGSDTNVNRIVKDPTSIKIIVEDCIRRRAMGETVTDESLIASHPDLMPELAEELRKLRIIGAGRQQAAQQDSDKADTFIPHSSESKAGCLEIRCPDCCAAVEIESDVILSNVTCTSCGNHFNLVASRDEALVDSLPATVGHFELVERLGMGSFGTVWKAKDVELDREVAVKIPRRGEMTGLEMEFFLREARAAAQLKHPNIVGVHEIGREGDSVYIVSDFVNGLTLGDWLADQKLTNREAAQLCAKIADALHHAHEEGVIHRDLKPANIMMDTIGEPHIMDFGLARREIGEVTMTLQGQLLGTPAYMSPEQAQGEAHKADRRADVYSLGVILFEMLSGELPFRGNTRMLIHHVIHDDPPSPRRFNANVAKDLETITFRCLEKQPSNRYATAHDVAEELRRYVAGFPIQARPVGAAERLVRWCRRYPAVASLIGVTFITLILGTIVSLSFGIDARRALAEKEQQTRQLRSALEDTFVFASEDVLADVPGMQTARQSLLENAREYYSGLLEVTPEDSTSQLDLANVHFMLGKVLAALGKAKEARVSLAEAHAIQSELLEQQPDQLSALIDVAKTHNELGKLSAAVWHNLRQVNSLDQLSVDEKETAIQSLEKWLSEANEVVRYRKKVVELQPTDIESTRLLANAYMQQGMIAAEQGTSFRNPTYFNSAEKAMRHAQDLRREALSDNPKKEELRRDLAKGFYNLANIKLASLASGLDLDAQSSEKLLLQAQEQAANAINAYEDVASSQQDMQTLYELAESYSLRGKIHFFRMFNEEAVSDSKHAIALLNGLSGQNPHVNKYRFRLVSTQYNLWQYLMDQGQTEEARRLADDNLDTFRDWLRFNPRDKKASQTLQELVVNGMAQQLFDAGFFEQASEFLSKALEKLESIDKTTDCEALDTAIEAVRTKNQELQARPGSKGVIGNL